ncbi:OLC1v1012876C3 [Oldenlandia corymbosa var. corymbosa]|uniref:OLC1v1012876C3 n=1 Tax=Oldenlandia corymbosa var. corymbosa TaxID=529605 RepID=A0AAV1DYY8_OLDCO|nr:OLC1v1012876C3 [Oldenlandia corymbosa var. corymbosa]
MELKAAATTMSSMVSSYPGANLFHPPAIVINPNLHRGIFSSSAMPWLRTGHQDRIYCKASHHPSRIDQDIVDKVMMFSNYSHDSKLVSLTSPCPLYGPYWADQAKELELLMSEYGIIRFRTLVEVKWWLKLSQVLLRFSKDTEAYLQSLIDEFDVDDALEVKKIKKVINHDVKAVEYFLNEKFHSHPEIAKVIEFSHFPRSAEDINNLALALMMKSALDSVILPAMDKVILAIHNMAKQSACVPILPLTHGQLASLTTLGKEIAIFSNMLKAERERISKFNISGKFAGAVGNYNAYVSANPNIDWLPIAKEFVTALGISFDPFVTQIGTRDCLGKLFHSISCFNNILVTFNQDMRGHISRGYFKTMNITGDIMLSTLAHKVGPVDFENSEENLVLANEGLSHLSMKLPISRFQRDITDSTVLRNLGVLFGHCLLAYKNALQGLVKLQVNEDLLTEDLNFGWEVLVDPVQRVMRTHGIPEPHVKLQGLTTGREVTEEMMRKFINDLDLPMDAKKTLLSLKSHPYIGIAPELDIIMEKAEKSCDS